MMCEHCRSIQTWRKFDAPRDYLACIAYIQKLVEQGEYPCNLPQLEEIVRGVCYENVKRYFNL